MGYMRSSNAARESFTSQVQYYINKLESGVAPWIRPYKAGTGSSLIPKNLKTNKIYRGINVMILWLTADQKGFTSRHWLTFNQVQDLGGHVQQGAKGTKIFFSSTYEEEKEQGASKVWFTKVYTVFNLNQVKGLVDPDLAAFASSSEAAGQKNERVEAFIRKTGAFIRFNDNGAPRYLPSPDLIEMPLPALFSSDNAYYSTILHELAHWTGHTARLNRLVKCKFGDEAYAYEELVAEIGAAFLSAYLELPLAQAQHPEYLDHWAKVLGKTPNILWSAASKSQELFDYLLTITGEQISAERADQEEEIAA